MKRTNRPEFEKWLDGVLFHNADYPEDHCRLGWEAALYWASQEIKKTHGNGNPVVEDILNILDKGSKT